MDSEQIWRKVLVRAIAASQSQYERKHLESFFLKIDLLIAERKVLFTCLDRETFKSFKAYRVQLFSDILKLLGKKHLTMTVEVADGDFRVSMLKRLERLKLAKTEEELENQAKFLTTHGIEIDDDLPLFAAVSDQELFIGEQNGQTNDGQDASLHHEPHREYRHREHRQTERQAARKSERQAEFDEQYESGSTISAIAAAVANVNANNMLAGFVTPESMMGLSGGGSAISSNNALFQHVDPLVGTGNYSTHVDGYGFSSQLQTSVLDYLALNYPGAQNYLQTQNVAIHKPTNVESGLRPQSNIARSNTQAQTLGVSAAPHTVASNTATITPVATNTPATNTIAANTTGITTSNVSVSSNTNVASVSNVDVANIYNASNAANTTNPNILNATNANGNVATVSVTASTPAIAPTSVTASTPAIAPTSATVSTPVSTPVNGLTHNENTGVNQGLAVPNVMGASSFGSTSVSYSPAFSNAQPYVQPQTPVQPKGQTQQPVGGIDGAAQSELLIQPQVATSIPSQSQVATQSAAHIQPQPQIPSQFQTQSNIQAQSPAQENFGVSNQGYQAPLLDESVILDVNHGEKYPQEAQVFLPQTYQVAQPSVNVGGQHVGSQHVDGQYVGGQFVGGQQSAHTGLSSLEQYPASSLSQSQTQRQVHPQVQGNTQVSQQALVTPEQYGNLNEQPVSPTLASGVSYANQGIQQANQQVVQTSAQPVAQPVAQTVAQPGAQPVAQTVAQPAAQQAVQQVANQVAQQDFQQTAQTVAVQASQQALQQVNQPFLEQTTSYGQVLSGADSTSQGVDQASAQTITETVGTNIGQTVAQAYVPPHNPTPLDSMPHHPKATDYGKTYAQVFGGGTANSQNLGGLGSGYTPSHNPMPMDSMPHPLKASDYGKTYAEVFGGGSTNVKSNAATQNIVSQVSLAQGAQPNVADLNYSMPLTNLMAESDMNAAFTAPATSDLTGAIPATTAKNPKIDSALAGKTGSNVGSGNAAGNSAAIGNNVVVGKKVALETVNAQSYPISSNAGTSVVSSTTNGSSSFSDAFTNNPQYSRLQAMYKAQLEAQAGLVHGGSGSIPNVIYNPASLQASSMGLPPNKSKQSSISPEAAEVLSSVAALNQCFYPKYLRKVKIKYPTAEDGSEVAGAPLNSSLAKLMTDAENLAHDSSQDREEYESGANYAMVMPPTGLAVSNYQEATYDETEESVLDFGSDLTEDERQRCRKFVKGLAEDNELEPEELVEIAPLINQPPDLKPEDCLVDINLPPEEQVEKLSVLYNMLSETSAQHRDGYSGCYEASRNLRKDQVAEMESCQRDMQAHMAEIFACETKLELCRVQLKWAKDKLDSKIEREAVQNLPVRNAIQAKTGLKNSEINGGQLLPDEDLITSSSMKSDSSEKKKFKLCRINPFKTFTTFVPSPENRGVINTAMMIASNPGNYMYNPLFIYGGSGLGKSHLLHAIANEIVGKIPWAQVTYTRAEDFIYNYVTLIKLTKQAKHRNNDRDQFNSLFKKCQVFIIDDVQNFTKAYRSRDAFFEILAEFIEQPNCQLILASDVEPNALNDQGFNNRLTSRFGSGVCCEVRMPNIGARRTITSAKCFELGIKLSETLIDYIANNIKTNIREIEGAVKTINSHIVSFGSISIKEAMQVLTAFIPLQAPIEDSRKNALSVDIIKAQVAREFLIQVSDLESGSKKKLISTARAMAMTLSKQLIPGTSLSDLGREFNKDHSSVSDAIKRMTERMKSEAELRNLYDHFLAEFQRYYS